MAQITIYLPDAVEARAREAAKAGGVPVSRWIAERLVKDLDAVWPEGVLRAAGALRDFPGVEEIRKSYGKDGRRERMR